MSSIVAIIGRPNVGKSTLFNRILRRRLAIEEKESGVTRDRLYGRAEWLGQEFILVDTGGMTFSSDEPFSEQVQQQADLAVAEAAVILFVVDADSGVTVLDEEIASMLQRAKKPIVLVVNKSDNPNKAQYIYDFYKLGIGEPIPVSAANALNIGDLLDKVLEFLPSDSVSAEEEAVKIAVIGRPNVGKSSLVNWLIGEERMIVSDLAGTTRNAVDTMAHKNGRNYLFVDTAGIRRQNRLKGSLEYYSILRSFRAVEDADIALLMVDSEESGNVQDQRLAGFVDQAGKGLIILINKIDLLPGQGNAILDELDKKFHFVSYAPRLLISVLTGKGMHKLFPLIDKVHEKQNIRLATPQLNDLFRDAFAVVPPPDYKGRQLKMYYITQAEVEPPTFILFVNDPSLCHFSYKRYLENELRKAFDFTGTSIRLILRRHSRKERA